MTGPRPDASMTSSKSSARAPVLLLGAGAGEATCGILYLGAYLRRHGVEASVRLFDEDVTATDLRRSMDQLVQHVRPRLVGISLKWFHHVARAKLICETLKRIDPSIVTVLGGNSASLWWKELLGWGTVDHVVMGDGEAPLLALCRGVEGPPNVVSKAKPVWAPLKYVQGPSSDDVHYSHFDELFLSQLDLHSFSGWVAPGKGCAENCLYCGGARGNQKAEFGRAKPFLRSVESVQKDHREVVPRAWQLRYDFSGSSAEFLQRAWGDVDLSRHATTYFLWGVPPKELVATLSKAFGRVFMVLDIGCFSQAQRADLLARGLLKPCPTDAELMDVIADCRRYPNVELEVSGIAGLPFASFETLAEERRLVQRVLDRGCVVGTQRLECQAGALVTEHPGRFGMWAEARTFEDFVDAFSRRPISGDGTVPMVRFLDAKLEAAVEETCLELQHQAHEHHARAKALTLAGRTTLKAAPAARTQVSLGDWLGRYRVPAKLAAEPVTVLRSVDGVGLSLVPSIEARRFRHAALQQGDEARALLTALESFSRPTTLEAAVGRLRGQAGLDDDAASELIEHLAECRFLVPA